MVPVLWSMPPQPEMVSRVTNASPSATPPTTLRPLRTLLSMSQPPVPAAGEGGVDTVGDGAEPGLDAGQRRQVVRLFGGVGGRHPRALGHEARDRRAGVAHHHAAGVLDDLGVTAAVG